MGIFDRFKAQAPQVVFNLKEAQSVPILEQQLVRVKQDIKKWREAINQAEMVFTPYRVELQRLYLDTILNGQVKAAIHKRRAISMQREYCLCNEAGEKDEKATELLYSDWFQFIMMAVIDAQLFGYSMVQLGSIDGDKMSLPFLIPRERIIPETNVISQSSIYDNVGINIYDPKYFPWLIYVTTPSDTGTTKCGLGLLNEVAPYEIYNRHAMATWSQFTQIYGVPFRVGKTDTKEKRVRDNMAKMLDNIGNAGWAVIDPDSSIEFVSGASNGQSTLFMDLLDKSDKMISKLLLGHADALDSTQGKLGAETSVEEALEVVRESDAAFVESVMNHNVLPKLSALGLSIFKGRKFKFENSGEEQEAKEKEQDYITKVADNVLKLSQAGLSVDPKQVEEMTGLKITTKPVAIGATPKIQDKLNNLYGI